MVAWAFWILGTAVLAVVELWLLNRNRRLVLPARLPHRPVVRRGGVGAAALIRQAARRSLDALWLRSDSGPTHGRGGSQTATAAASEKLRLEPADAQARDTEASAGQRQPSSNATPPRRELQSHAAKDVLFWINADESPWDEEPQGSTDEPLIAVEPSPSEPSPTVPENGSSTAVPTPTMAEDGVVYVDSLGRLTFANQAARDLLGWTGGELALGDVFAGGARESAALLETVARQESLERSVTFRTGRSAARLHISALALRDRNGNLWGAALFIRQPQQTVDS
jgi:PAS domain-containing protein